jgi:ABC-type transport system substrate-binding protein
VQAEVCLLLENGFEAMKLLPEMNTTGIDYDVRIAAYDNWDFFEPFDLPMWPSWWGADYADPHGFVSPLHSGSTYAKKQGYNNSVMDDLIMQGMVETDPAVRLQIYNQIQELAAHDRPSMWLYSYKEFTTFRAWLKGIGLRFQPMSSYYYIYHVYKDYGFLGGGSN